MLELLVFLPFLVPVVVANFSERHRHTPYTTADPGTGRFLDTSLRVLPYVLLAAINLSLLGVAALALLNALVQQFMPAAVEGAAVDLNWGLVAVASLLTGLLAFVPMIAGVRRWLARFLPIDPASPVHMTALVLAAYEIGLSLAQMALIGGLDRLADAGLELTPWDVLLSGRDAVLEAALVWMREGH